MSLPKKHCSRCGNEALSDAQCYAQCGTQYSFASTEPTPYICDQCESPLPGGSRFCPGCGQAFDEAVPSFIPPPSPGFRSLATPTQPVPVTPHPPVSIPEPIPRSMSSARNTAIGIGAVIAAVCLIICFCLFQLAHLPAPTTQHSASTSMADTSSSPPPKNLSENSSSQPNNSSEPASANSVEQITPDTHPTISSGADDINIGDKNDNIVKSIAALDTSDTLNAYALEGSGLDDAPVSINDLQNTVLSAEDLRGKSLRALSLSHSTIYALHGCTFTRPAIKSYFEAQAWYRPNAGFTEATLSTTEQANAQSIRAMERSHFGYGRHSFDENGNFYQTSRDPLQETVAHGLGQTDDLISMEALQHKLITNEDMSGRSLAALSASYNAIYAVHGYVFKRPSLQRLFNQAAWYRPNSSFHEQNLSGVEQANLKIIRAYERTRYGY